MGLLFQARTRQLAGFVMPRLKDCEPIQHLYNPVQRLKCYPRVYWFSENGKFAFGVRA
jgi:DNA-binding helix-hairpin-helix protein with protein kinase domain